MNGGKENTFFIGKLCERKKKIILIRKLFLNK